ncbi:MAG: hypothetical protein ACM3XM_11890 [Mycobacterium leprae]
MIAYLAIGVLLVTLGAQYTGTLLLCQQPAREVRVFLSSLFTAFLFLMDAILFSLLFPDGVAPGPMVVALALYGELFVLRRLDRTPTHLEQVASVKSEQKRKPASHRRRGKQRIDDGENQQSGFWTVLAAVSAMILVAVVLIVNWYYDLFDLSNDSQNTNQTSQTKRRGKRTGPVKRGKGWIDDGDHPPGKRSQCTLGVVYEAVCFGAAITSGVLTFLVLPW